MLFCFKAASIIFHFFRKLHINHENITKLENEIYKLRNEMVLDFSSVEQTRRKQLIKDTCEKHALNYYDYYYKGKSVEYSHAMKSNSFLKSEDPPVIFCYNFKVASQSWMAIFAKLLGDEEYYNRLKNTKEFYR